MAKKLGYTWYQENWRSSQKVWGLTLTQRGLYRELIDLAYDQDNKIVLDYDTFSHYCRIRKSVLVKMLSQLMSRSLIILHEDYISVTSVESRLQLVRSGRLGGLSSSKEKEKDKYKKKEKYKEKGIDVNVSKILELYPYCQDVNTVNIEWDYLDDLTRQKVIEHAYMYLDHHSEHKKTEFLPRLENYLSKKIYLAPKLPYEHLTETKSDYDLIRERINNEN